MKPVSSETLGIVLGLNCDLSCSHCLTSSSPGESLKVSRLEIDTVVREIRTEYENGLTDIYFTGGEPFLHLDEISAIQDGLVDIIEGLSFTISTNGTFVKSKKCFSDIGNIAKVSKISLSADEFHSAGLGKKHFQDLKEICDSYGIELEVNCVFGSPISLVFKKITEELGIPFNPVQLIFAGRAKSLLSRKLYGLQEPIKSEESCGLLNHALFVPERGFTRCTRNLVWNTRKFDEMLFAGQIGDLFSSQFYQNLSKKKFGEMSSKLGDKEFRDQCELCEAYHNEFGRTN